MKDNNNKRLRCRTSISAKDVLLNDVEAILKIITFIQKTIKQNISNK